MDAIKEELRRIEAEQNEMLEFRNGVESGPDSYEKIKDRQAAYRDGFFIGARWAIEKFKRGEL